MPLRACVACGQALDVRVIRKGRGRCPVCRRAADRQKDELSRRQGYRTAAWKRTAQAVVRRHPVCQRCGKRPSAIAHHLRGLRPVDPGGTDERYLRAVCASCHQLLHKR
jgi:hypothetical protein